MSTNLCENVSEEPETDGVRAGRTQSEPGQSEPGQADQGSLPKGINRVLFGKKGETTCSEDGI